MGRSDQNVFDLSVDIGRMPCMLKEYCLCLNQEIVKQVMQTLNVTAVFFLATLLSFCLFGK